MSYTTNFRWHRSEDVPITFTPTSTTNISGWTFAFYAYADEELTDLLYTLTDGSGITVLNATAGTVEVDISSANDNRTPCEFYYQFRRVDSGHNTVLADGKIKLLP